MSVALKFEVVRDTATPELRRLIANVNPHRLATDIGSRGLKLVQRNFFSLGKNKKGWPTTHFWKRAAEASNVQVGADFAIISANQIGLRQRIEGGDIAPVHAKMLAIPAVPDAYGKRAAEYGNNLKFGFALDPESGKMRPALVEPEATSIKIGKVRKNGSRSIKPTSTTTAKIAIFWLLAHVHQEPNPEALPSDEEFSNMIDQSIAAVLRFPIITGGNKP